MLWDRLLYPILRIGGWVPFLLYFRGRVVREDILPQSGPVIIVANHASLLDGILIHAVSPRPLRVFVAAEWVAWWPARPLLRMMGAIPVDRQRPNPDAFNAALAALLRGQVVALFPEGGIQASGQLGPFRNGAARLALRTGSRIVPCAIIGSREAMPWPKHLPRPRRITLRCGVPISFGAQEARALGAAAGERTAAHPAADGLHPQEGSLRKGGNPARETLQTATARIRDAVAKLLGQGHARR